MKNKIISGITVIILVICALVASNVFATNKIANLATKEVKQGENIYMDIVLSNILYTNYEINFKTSIYLEPTVLDIGTISLNNKEFTITKDDVTNANLTNNSFSVKYLVPEYIAVGTTIKIDIKITNKDAENENITEELEVKVISNQQNNGVDNNGNGGNNGTDNNGNNNNNSNNGGTGANGSSNNSGKTGNQISNSGKTVSGLGSTTETVTYKGSRNNYLKSLKISGYSLNPGFNKTNNTYFITIPENITSITVTATKEDSTATVKIAGNTGLKKGMNKVLISVEAQNGDVRYYRIYVTRS